MTTGFVDPCHFVEFSPELSAKRSNLGLFLNEETEVIISIWFHD